MHRRLVITLLMVLVGAVALPRCSSCWDDPDDPKIWVKRLKEAKSKDDRETALFNLYRIYAVREALIEQDPKNKEKLEKFRKQVNPVLVSVFKKQINNRYVIPAQIVEKLVIFEANNPEAGQLFVEIIKKYTGGEADEFGDEDRQETLAAKAVDGLGKMALRGTTPEGALDAINQMIDRICVKRGSGKIAVEGLDPRSFVRNAVVKSIPNFMEGKVSRSKLARILAKIVHFGQIAKSGQDPMVTIFAIRLMGDVGDVSDNSVKALVLSLLGKGRGRRFFSFAATSVAKLPLGSDGKHPAIEPLTLMLKGDPWNTKIIDLKGQVAELKDSRRPNKGKIKELENELDPLERKYKEKKVMPACPYEKKYHYICKELFWKANVEDWEKTEPGVIPMNALMVLREIGDLSVVDVMIDRYGIEAVKKRWLKEAHAQPGQEDTKDRTIPGVQMQKMMIPSYGGDMNIRSEMLRSLGRMDAASASDEAKKELRRSLTFSGDPSMLVKAGEGIYLNGYDEGLMKALTRQVTNAASFMMVNFKKRQVKMFFWGKVTRGSCDEASKLEEEFKDCLMDPPKMPGEKEVKDANWNCFHKYRKYWLAEFYYAIGYHKPNDYAKLIQPFCQKNSHWYTEVRPKLEAKAKAGDKAAREQLYACAENPDPKAVKKGDLVKCNQWSHCGPKNNFLCLDGHWQLRLHFYKHASLLTTEQHVDELLKITSDDVMSPHRLNKKDLPEKDKSAFYDSDDEMYLGHYPWPKKVEELRREKAKTILEKQLCESREFLRVVKRCGSDVNCYVSVVKGAESMRLPVEDCDNLKPPYTRDASKRETASYRHKLKALRLLAHFGRKGGPESREAKSAIKAAISYYDKSGRLAVDAMRETREMILLVLDRAGSYLQQKDVMCPYPYTTRQRSILREKYNIPHYETRLARVKKDNKEKQIERYKDLIKRYTAKVNKELAKISRDQPCYKILKLVIEDETSRRVKGAWQINRDARNTLGRLARRSKMRYDQI